MEEIYLQRLNDFQPQEGSANGAQESDLPIVVRDGNTDHTAKDQAGMQSEQSTHAKGTNALIEVPPARVPEEPGAVIPHAGICEGGVGQPTSLP